jgi:hypothetical protein
VNKKITDCCVKKQPQDLDPIEKLSLSLGDRHKKEGWLVGYQKKSTLSWEASPVAVPTSYWSA